MTTPALREYRVCCDRMSRALDMYNSFLDDESLAIRRREQDGRITYQRGPHPNGGEFNFCPWCGKELYK